MVMLSIDAPKGSPGRDEPENHSYQHARKADQNEQPDERNVVRNRLGEEEATDNSGYKKARADHE